MLYFHIMLAVVFLIASIGPPAGRKRRDSSAVVAFVLCSIISNTVILCLGYSIGFAGTWSYERWNYRITKIEHQEKWTTMHLNALVAHGAYNTFLDAKYNRGQSNDDYWMQYMQGVTPTMRKTPLVYQKFENSLKASGINISPSKDRMNVMAMTDADVGALAGDREISSGETLRWEKDKSPVAGGLFDPAIFGMDGSRWGKFTPITPILNPVMEEPARILLGLKQKELKAIMDGSQEYGKYGTGFQAIGKALTDINVPLAMNSYRMKIETGKLGERDHAIKALGFLKGCEQTGLHPRDWMLSQIPILPPKFRPVSEMKDSNVPLVDDANYLYKLMIDTNNGLKDLRKVTSNTRTEEYGLYDAYKQVTGLAEPTHPKLVQRQVRGLLKHVFGVGSSKFSMVQRSLLGTPADTVGRAVTVTSPDMGFDEVGLPEDKAWSIYRPHLVHRLTKRGVPWAQAARMIEDRTDVAREALLAEMDERPVIVDRAPVLHKWGVLALKPKLMQGDSLHLNSFLQKGLGQDFDGNCTEFNTELFFRLSKFYLNQQGSTSVASCGEDAGALSSFYVKRFQEKLLSLYGQEAADSFMVGESVLCKIGELPRLGDPAKDKNGADVYFVPDCIEVCSYDVETGEQVWSSVSAYTVEQNVPCVCVSTSGGRSVTVSNNESLAAYNHETGLLDKLSPINSICRWVPVVEQATDKLPGKLAGKQSEEPQDDYIPAMKSEIKDAVEYWYVNWYSMLIGEEDIDANIGTLREIVSEYSAWYAVKRAWYMTRDEAIERLSHIPQDMCPHLRKHVANTSVRWERYEKFESAETQDVFDICVEGTKVFVISNGLVIYDTMNFHVPASEEAVKEAYELLLPSKSLVQSSDMRSVQPRIISENAGGLYLASLPPDKKQKTRTFVSWEDAKKAYQRGELSIDEPVAVLSDKPLPRRK